MDQTSPDREPSAVAPNGWPWSRLRGFRDGEVRALTEVYRLHAREVAGLLRRGFSFDAAGRPRRFVGYPSPFELQDALQETFRRAFEPKARAAYDGVRPYGPYLLAIARNVVLRSFRTHEVLFPEQGETRCAPPENVAAGSHAPDPEDSIQREQLRRIVRAFLSSLDDDDRRLVELRFVEGKSQRDAAAALGIGRQRIRTREARIRARLLRRLRDHGEDAGVPGAFALSLLGVFVLRTFVEGVR